MRKFVGPLAVGVIWLTLSAVNAPSANAACHAFTITASPSTVQEGEPVTVTVTRDATVNPSSIDVTSVDQSARAGADYTAVQMKVQFTAETKQTFTVSTTEDTTSEANETFALRLSNPDGCQANRNFNVGPPATVTVADDDAAPAPATTAKPAAAATTAAPKPGVTARPATTAGTVAPASTTTEATFATTDEGLTDETTTTAEPDDLVIGENSGSDGGVGTALIIGGIAVLGAAAGAAALYARSRRSSPLGP